MTVQDIAKLGKLLARFLTQFADCFARPAGRELLIDANRLSPQNMLIQRLLDALTKPE
jgi:hypothetical protein